MKERGRKRRVSVRSWVTFDVANLVRVRAMGKLGLPLMAYDTRNWAGERGLEVCRSCAGLAVAKECGEGFLWNPPLAKWPATEPFYCNLYCAIPVEDTCRALGKTKSC